MNANRKKKLETCDAAIELAKASRDSGDPEGKRVCFALVTDFDTPAMDILMSSRFWSEAENSLSKR